MVDLGDLAFHAGGSTMPDGKQRANERSVGVELEGAISEPVTQAQYIALAKLISRVSDAAGGFLPNRNLLLADYVTACAGVVVVSHQQINEARKIDPGPNFNFAYLAALLHGLSPTSRSSWFQPPFDPAASVRTSLLSLLEEVAHPISRADQALTSQTAQRAEADARVAGIVTMSRGTIASWASTQAQKAGRVLEDTGNATAAQSTRLEAGPVRVPATNQAAVFDFDAYTSSTES